MSVFETLRPDLLVICVGAKRTAAPLQELDWEGLRAPWDIDVKASFFFCKAALGLPLPQGATIILISSGAAIAGSSLGDYAGAKRMRCSWRTIARRNGIGSRSGLRFLALAPMFPMLETERGKGAVEGYSDPRYLRFRLFQGYGFTANTRRCRQGRGEISDRTTGWTRKCLHCFREGRDSMPVECVAWTKLVD